MDLSERALGVGVTGMARGMLGGRVVGWFGGGWVVVLRAGIGMGLTSAMRRGLQRC